MEPITTEPFSEDYAYRIMKRIDKEGPRYVRQLRQPCKYDSGFHNQTLSKQLRILSDSGCGYLLKEHRDRRDYYSMTSKGQAWFSDRKKREENWKALEEAMKGQFPHMGEWDWKEFSGDLKDDVDGWFKWIQNKTSDLSGNFDIEKFPIEDEKYKGFITIHWELTEQELKRREKLGQVHDFSLKYEPSAEDLTITGEETLEFELQKKWGQMFAWWTPRKAQDQKKDRGSS